MRDMTIGLSNSIGTIYPIALFSPQYGVTVMERFPAAFENAFSPQFTSPIMSLNHQANNAARRSPNFFAHLRRWWHATPTPMRSRRERLGVEEFEPRIVPIVSGTTISGAVFQSVDLINASQTTPDAGLAGISVVLDGDTANPQITDANGAYTFANVTANQQHTVAVVLPAGYWGFSAQSLNYTVSLGSQPYANLNFALTGSTQALVQNLYQRVLIRSGDVGGFNDWTNVLRTQAMTGGQVFASFVGSQEFQSTVTPIANVLGGFFPGETINPDLLRNNIQIARASVTADANVLNILYSQPFLAEFGDTSLLSNTQFVTFLYDQLLHRTPDAPGLAYWSGLLSSATDPSNRGQVVLGIAGSQEFGQKNPALGNEVAVSMAYLGLLGRPAEQGGFDHWVGYLNDGNSVAALGDQILASAEFASLKGFNDVFLSDIQSYPVPSAVNSLNRLQKYDPAKATFDIPVTAQSLTGLTGSAPSNVYVIAHGWAPGFTEDVLLNSTPGKPLTWWDTVKYPGGASPQQPDSIWMFQGVNKVSVEGLAQAIVDSDPSAQVVLFSWIDESATPGEGAFSLQNAASLEDDVPYLSDSEANTQVNGLRMAAAIQAALGPQFLANQGLLHLMGHSHGSRVATVAALALQTASVPVTQLTTLESPESGPALITANVTGEANARNFLWYYMQQMNLSRTPLVGNSRTPTGATFIDNYYSSTGVGMAFGGYAGLESIVDTELSPLVIYGLEDPVSAHSYPPPWYGQASLANPLSPIATTMTGAGIASVDNTATVTVSDFASFPGTGQNGFFIQVDNEIMQVTAGAGTATWTLGVRGINGTTPATHTNLASPVTMLQNNGLAWSPLINPSLAQYLVSGYAQTWSTYNFNQQFILSPNPTSATPVPAPVPLQYARQYQIGGVVDTGSSITLTAAADTPLALAALSFTPISQSVTGQAGMRGSGLSFEFQFTDAQPGDRLVVWERGKFGLKSADLSIDTGSLGYRTVPLFVMTAGDAGSAAQKAIVNLDAYFNNSTPDPLALGIFHDSQIPTFGFSLIHAGASTSTVTVTNLQQLNDGTGP